MHAAGAAAYGCPPGTWTGDGFIGPLPLPHRACGSFGEFFATLRILPFTRQLRDAGTIEASEVAVLEHHPGSLRPFYRKGDLDLGQRPEEGHVVLADPEGNEFDVIAG